jgi:hypothetical protein
LATFGQTVSNLPVVCGAGAATCTKSVRKKRTLPPLQLAVTASWRRKKTPSRQLSGLQTREGGTAEEEIAENTQNYNGEGVLPQPYYARCLLRGGAPRQYSTTTTAGAPNSSGRFTCRSKIETPTSGQQQIADQSVQAPTVNSQTLDSMLRVVTVVQQIMTEFNVVVSELEKRVAVTKIVLNLMKQDDH